MADMIARLKVDSSEYDSKIQRAAKGIQHLAEACHNAGGFLNVLEDENREYIQSLGNMATVATTARGKIAELTSAFIDIKSVYNSLSQEEKNGEFGKELSKQLDIMKGRIQEGKRELADINNEINGGGGLTGALDSLAGKFGMNIKQLTGWGAALAAAKTALDVAKDAFFNNEEQLDEWGRIVESSQSLYNGFLNALNTGDISGFLNNIGNIVSAAREAYDALDALGTYNAFNQINIERTRTTMTESISDYRSGQGTKDAVKAAGEAYKKELKDRQRMENEAYLAAVKNMAAKRGVSQKDLLDAMSGTYGHYEDLKNVQPTGIRQTVVGAGMFARTGTERFAQNDRERLGEALRHLNDTELQSLQALGAQAQRTATEVAQVDKQLTRVLNSRQPGETTTPTRTATMANKTVQTELQQNQKKINDLTQEYVRLGDQSTESSRQRQAEIQKEIELLRERNGLLGLRVEQAQGRLTLGAGDFQQSGLANVPVSGNPFAGDTAAMLGSGTLGLQLDDSVIKKVNEQLSVTQKLAQKTQKAFSLAAEATSNLGAAFAAIEDPAAKAAGTVLQAIASIALGFAQAAAAKDTTASGWAWLAWLAAGTAAMATTISTVHSLTGFANGGMVKGNSYSGDNLIAQGPDGGLIGLNAGEVVLNRSQVAGLSRELQNGGGQGKMSIVGVLRGEDVALMVDRYGRRTGRGELLFAKNL